MNSSFIRARKRAALAVLALGAVSFSAAAETSSDLQAGIDAFNRGDLPGAMAFFEKAAEAGSPEAQVRIGFLLDHAEDDENAVRWYRAAAEQGYPAGTAGLAQMYAKGEGVPQDTAKARELFEDAAEQGHAPSIRVLIAAYENGGLDVDRDEERLAYWQGKQASLDSRKE